MKCDELTDEQIKQGLHAKCPEHRAAHLLIGGAIHNKVTYTLSTQLGLVVGQLCPVPMLDPELVVCIAITVCGQPAQHTERDSAAMQLQAQLCQALTQAA